VFFHSDIHMGVENFRWFGMKRVEPDSGLSGAQGSQHIDSFTISVPEDWMSTQSTTPTSINPVLESPLPREVLGRLYASMLKARQLSSRFRNAPKLSEAVLAGSLENAEFTDVIVSATANPILEVLRGAELTSLSKLKLASKAKVDLPAPESKVISAGPESMAGVAVGLAVACKRAQSLAVVIAFVPTKATRTAAWAEAVKYSGAYRLPVIFVLDSSDSRRGRNHHGPDLSHWPCPTIAVDSKDVIAVYRVTKEAISAARRGHGPTLVDCVDFVAPGRRGIDGRDALVSFRGYLKRHDAWSDEWAAALDARLKEEVGRK
jgi:hypothetical protein